MADTIYPPAGQLDVDMLLPASFRGIAFDCFYTREVLARDTVVYEYPWRDGAEVGDHGLKALNLRLPVLFWGNGYQARLRAFLAALNPRPGELLHPVYDSLRRVQLLEAGVEHEVAPLNAVTVELVFVEASTEQALFAPVSTTPRTGGLPDHVTAGLSDALATIRRGNGRYRPHQ
ncbi:MAG: DNA circularization N-terminal domain-containing protein [Sodalis sp. (in: enterobacteria)]|uniref:DNA circularization N-terminal domain-containing protein n=1 Tax=Sodalis sp. (in: enterobacteria) TaxID=1898979 RepID=UPI003F2A519E